MDLVFLIYFIDNFAGDPFIGWGGVVLTTIVVILFFGIHLIVTEDFDKTTSRAASVKWYFITALVIFGVGTFLNSVVPERDTAYKMLAAYGVTEMVQTDEAKRIGGNALKVLDKAMLSYLNENEKVASNDKQ